MIKIQRYAFKRIKKFDRSQKYSASHTAKDGQTEKQTEDKTRDETRLENYENSSNRKINVCIIGGGITPIFAAACIKQSMLVKCINVVDPKDTMASAVLDLNHIDTTPRVKYFSKSDVQAALNEMDIVALMDETDQRLNHSNVNAEFKSASTYARRMTDHIIQRCPDALVAIFVRPVTAMLPMITEIYRWAGLWDPDKIIGSVSIDSMRTDAVTANLLNLNPAFLSVPIVGGADSNTIVPLLSCAEPVNRFTNSQERMLSRTLRRVDKEMASLESGGPTFSAGHAAGKLILTLANGLNGNDSISYAFVRSNTLPFCRFFTSKLQFGRNGVKANFGLPKVSPFELSLIDQAIPLINKSVELGISAVPLGL